MSTTTPAPGEVDTERRNALITAVAIGGVGCAAGIVPFVDSMTPSERAKAAGAPVEVNIAAIAPGEMRKFEWRGKPVWVLRRTPEMIASVKAADPHVADPDSKRNAYPTPVYAKNELRSIKPEFFIAVGICTHLGCSPQGPFAAGVERALGSDPGFLCPCHGSTFDLAGRVYKNKPAPDNLEVPPHKYLSDGLVLIGDDSKA
jgi:ubiquinol-cytochrome c reductase iron-sulfur subunit